MEARGRHRDLAFIGTMVALCALDLILLMWTFGPFTSTQRSFHPKPNNPVYAATTESDKPSPLGRKSTVKTSFAPVSYARGQ